MCSPKHVQPRQLHDLDNNPSQSRQSLISFFAGVRLDGSNATIIGQKPGLVSKHLAVLRGAGLVVMNRRLYQVPAAYIAVAGKRHLDFGHCLLRLPDANGLPTL